MTILSQFPFAGQQAIQKIWLEPKKLCLYEYPNNNNVIFGWKPNDLHSQMVYLTTGGIHITHVL